MPITNILKKASNYILGQEDVNKKMKLMYEDNEILFCKNNVCIHPSVTSRQECDMYHYPGYLSVTTKTFIDQFNSAKRPTLILSWIPNSSLCKWSSSDINAERLLNYSTTIGNESSFKKNSPVQNNCIGEHYTHSREKLENKIDIQELQNELQPLLGDKKTLLEDLEILIKKEHITSVNITLSNPTIENANIPQTYCFVNHDSEESIIDKKPSWVTADIILLKQNIEISKNLDDNTRISKKIVCRRFSVDLSEMRSLRLFFNDKSCTSGQLVIASRESQYKILHFHYGGLDHLAQILHQWHSFLHNINASLGHENEMLRFHQFVVCRPDVKKNELHPEEGNIQYITTNFFYGTLLNDKGQIDDYLMLQKCVFFGGLEKSIRKTIWPFLLNCYPFTSTFEDRAMLMDIKRQEYEEIAQRRLYTMSPEEQITFWKTVQCVIEKDVIRTDRSNPFFGGDENPNSKILKNILLNYAFYNLKISYFQGMSDLLAPILCEVQNEFESFWCFVGLMKKTSFVCTPTDYDIDRYINYLRELIRIMLPNFYSYMEKKCDTMDLLFCHRWLLLCFKREFTDEVVIRMWEACWSNYLTDYFNLFLCLAIIAVYADDIINQNLSADEMILHFSSLAMYMDGHLILRKARGLLHQYRQLQKIPCTLAGLCKRCGPGMWDSEHCPALECVGHTEDEKCSLAMD